MSKAGPIERGFPEQPSDQYNRPKAVGLPRYAGQPGYEGTGTPGSPFMPREDLGPGVGYGPGLPNPGIPTPMPGIPGGKGGYLPRLLDPRTGAQGPQTFQNRQDTFNRFIPPNAPGRQPGFNPNGANGATSGY